MRKLIFSLLSIFGFGGSATASDFQPNVDGNRQVIQQLLKHGANPDKPHPLEHHFFCYSPESLNKLMKKGESLGYKPANLGEGSSDGKKYWYGDLIKETKLDLKLINKENSVMLGLAYEFQAEYDGWGTPVVE